MPDVADCWFDSGSMPVAQWHYPFENGDVFEIAGQADYISEAIDQTRGWFYTLHAVSTLLFDRPAFENAICLGVDGGAYFFRCTACGDVLVMHKGKSWQLEPVEGAA